MSIHRTEKVVQIEQPSGGSPHEVGQLAPPSGGGHLKSAQIEPKSTDENVRALIISVRRSVAIAKLVEFESQALLLGGYVSADMMPMPVAADALHDVAIANDLTSIHGDDLIQAIIAAGLSGGCL